MESIETTNCKQHGHPEFRIDFDPEGMPKFIVNDFAISLENMIESGAKFADGESFQIGWSFTRLVLEGDGCLTFREPDFNSMPIVWQRGLTKTLRHLRLHKDVVESVLAIDSLSIPSLRESCIICQNLKNAGHVMMDRQPSKGMDSGWFIGCVDAKHDHNDAQSLRSVSLYEAIVTYAPQALGYLGLPTGLLVLLGEEQPKFIHGDHELPVRKGTYLEALSSKSQKGIMPKV